MALNFPDPADQQIYVDSETGLKYIYNTVVQAWESAIQPPAIVSASSPNVQIEGFLWYDGTTLYVYHNSAWVAAGGGGSGANVSIGDTAPPTPGAGDLWWDSAAGRMFVYYIDIDSAQWVDANAGVMSE